MQLQSIIIFELHYITINVALLINNSFIMSFVTGPEMLLRQSSDLQSHERVNTNFGGDTGDALEAHEWRFVRTLNGMSLCYTGWHPKPKEQYGASAYIHSSVSSLQLCFQMVTQIYLHT